MVSENDLGFWITEHDLGAIRERFQTELYSAKAVSAACNASLSLEI